MTHHHHGCLHLTLGYCAQCDVVYCKSCEREWGFRRYAWTYPAIYTQAGGTTQFTPTSKFTPTNAPGGSTPHVHS